MRIYNYALLVCFSYFLVYQLGMWLTYSPCINWGFGWLITQPQNLDIYILQLAISIAPYLI